MSDAALLTIVTGILAGLAGFVTSIVTARSAASKTELESLRATISLLQSEIARLSNRVQQLEGEKTELNKRIDCLEKENDALKEENADYKARLEKLESRRKPQ